MQLNAVIRKEVWIDDNAFPLDKVDVDISDVVLGMDVIELEKLVTQLSSSSRDLDYIADRAGFVYDGPFTVLIDEFELAEFMIANGLDCPSAIRNPNFYSDGEIVGWAGPNWDTLTGEVERWDLATNTTSVAEQTIEEVGFHTLTERECSTLGLDRAALQVAKTRFSIDQTAVSYEESVEIAEELREASMTIRRPR